MKFVTNSCFLQPQQQGSDLAPCQHDPDSSGLLPAVVTRGLEEYEATPKLFHYSDAGSNCIAVSSSPRFSFPYNYGSV